MAATLDTPTDHDANGDSALEGQAAEHWFARLGRFSARRRKPLIFAWLVVALSAAPLAISVSS